MENSVDNSFAAILARRLYTDKYIVIPYGQTWSDVETKIKATIRQTMRDRRIKDLDDQSGPLR